MKPRNLISGISLLCLCALASAQEKPDRFKEQLEPVIKQVMRQTGMPGFAIAIVENQKIVYSAAFEGGSCLIPGVDVPYCTVMPSWFEGRPADWPSKF